MKVRPRWAGEKMDKNLRVREVWGVAISRASMASERSVNSVRTVAEAEEEMRFSVRVWRRRIKESRASSRRSLRRSQRGDCEIDG